MDFVVDGVGAADACLGAVVGAGEGYPGLGSIQGNALIGDTLEQVTPGDGADRAYTALPSILPSGRRSLAATRRKLA